MQSIIVYRNPLEAALWEGGLMWPVVASTCVGGVLAVGTVMLYQKLFPRGNRSDVVAIVSAVIGVVATLYNML